MLREQTHDDVLRLRKEDLLTIPTNRVPVALCLDVSGSMDGPPIHELNEGVQMFLNALRSDPIASASAEVAIVAFADRAEVVLDFQSLHRIEQPPVLQTGSHLGNSTNLGAGANLSLNLLNARKREYEAAGVEYFQPFVVLMTDGQPTTDLHHTAASTFKQLEASRKLVTFPIGIGPHADMNVLSLFSDKRPPLRLKGLNFAAFFEWLSKSIVRMSHSRPGESVPLDLKSIPGWGEI
jgi:uncharacterized protein YegL